MKEKDTVRKGERGCMSKGRLKLSCNWPSILGQNVETTFPSKRESKAFCQQGGDMSDFMEKDRLKKLESKVSKLCKEVTATSG